MSTKNGKYRKKRQSKNFPWALTAFGSLLLIVAFFLFTNRSADAGGTPTLTVDQEKIDLGYVKLGEYRSIKIKVTNTGTGILRFREKPYIEVLQGCCPPELNTGAMSLNPGESTYVETPDFMMHEGMDGPHDFAVHFPTNDPATSDLVVHVISDWGP